MSLQRLSYKCSTNPLWKGLLSLVVPSIICTPAKRFKGQGGHRSRPVHLTERAEQLTSTRVELCFALSLFSVSCLEMQPRRESSVNCFETGGGRLLLRRRSVAAPVTRVNLIHNHSRDPTHPRAKPQNQPQQVPRTPGSPIHQKTHERNTMIAI